LVSILRFSRNFHFLQFSGIRSDTQIYNSDYQSDLDDPLSCIKQRSQLALNDPDEKRSVSPLLADDDFQMEQNPNRDGSKKYIVKGARSTVSLLDQVRQKSNSLG